MMDNNDTITIYEPTAEECEWAKKQLAIIRAHPSSSSLIRQDLEPFDFLIMCEYYAGEITLEAYRQYLNARGWHEVGDDE